MRETDEDLEQLQALLDVSFDRSGEHLRSAFGQEHRLSAASLVDRLPGLFEMHFAVIAADGAPLVAPVDGFVLRGKICLGLPAPSVRARLVRRDPRVSASFNADDVAFIAHGTFVEVDEAHPMVELFDRTSRELYVAQYGEWFNDWLDHKTEVQGRGVTGYIEPRLLFAKGATPELDDLRPGTERC